MSKDYSELEEILGYHFKDKKHIDTAFIHKSYANEMHMENSSYERYEFLGDAILEYITSKELFLKYPEKSEGELTKLRASLVCEYTLSQITKELGFGKYLYLSHGEELTGGMNRPSILCDLFESVLGAIFLLLTAALMFSDSIHDRLVSDTDMGGSMRSFLLALTRKNNWIVTLSIGALFELYSSFRLDRISKKQD